MLAPHRPPSKPFGEIYTQLGELERGHEGRCGAIWRNWMQTHHRGGDIHCCELDFRGTAGLRGGSVHGGFTWVFFSDFEKRLFE